jgi:hypothetical protein
MPKELASLLQIYGREKALETVLNATAKVRMEWCKIDTPVKLSPEAQELKEICVSFGQTGVKWAKILSILLKEKIEINDPDLPYLYVPFSMFITKCDEGAHNYGVGKFIIVLFPADPECKSKDTVKAIRETGDVGNTIRLSGRILALASDKEIRQYINSIFDKVGDIDPFDVLKRKEVEEF